MCRRRYDYLALADEVPAVREDSSLRASQAERDRVVERLRAHAGEGRLDVDELEQRVEAALAARTRGDLAALLADLPEPSPSRGRGVPARAIALGSLATALLPLAAAIALLSFAPHGIAWIGWPLLGWWFFAGLPAAGVGFAWCGHSRRRRERTVIV